MQVRTTGFVVNKQHNVGWLEGWLYQPTKNQIRGAECSL